MSAGAVQLQTASNLRRFIAFSLGRKKKALELEL
jgi:hypothetical protein